MSLPSPVPAASPWLITPVHHDEPPVRLFVFHHAGGGASSYVRWAHALQHLAEVIPVQLPGRENRRREAPYRSLLPLASDVANALQPYLDVPFAFFGHSMGAFISYEIARVVRDRFGRNPEQLFVSGFQAPHLPRTEPPIYMLPDAEFVEALMERYEGIPSVILQDPELLALFLPVLRADLELVETYEFQPAEQFTCPIYALGGSEDPRLDERRLSAWREHTDGEFGHRFFEGGHFYLQAQAAAVHDVLATQLESLRSPKCKW